MLWYLLSPLRGTTQPPRLSSNHPIRKAFYRHGKTTAQHWLIAMLVSVAIAAAFSYPTILLSEISLTGITGYPHHVWTTAKPVNEGTSSADMEMRQIWVHGSYMQALNKSVLTQGLSIQQSIVGDWRTTDLDKSSQDQWGFHSPLIYWNSSQQSIDADDDVLKTINDQQRTMSSLNVVLRPASVFAGKKFEGGQLLAADALIITLMRKRDADDAASEWQDSMYALTQNVCAGCTVFPQDDQIAKYRIFEFSFQPLSIREHLALTVAYSAMALYVLLSLRRMKAFHSRFGLVVTAITQMTCSILASFTICGLLKINLSMIPQNAYPFVVLILGVENMFRLINAVLAYPPTMATEMRIANALGDVGPMSIAAAAQNLLILSLLSTVVSPGVAAFCAFAAIATLFDSFFLLTFFVAVLNVDIRRLELQDALTARHSSARLRRRPSPSQHTWFDALLQGRLPFSTRMAGTLVTTTFILGLNYHFFEQRETTTSLRDLLGLVRGGPPSLSDLNTFALPPINASLTPSEWMRMQDFDTAKEVMRLTKPDGESFTVRVFAPLVVVLANSDRTGVSKNGIAWTHTVRSFALHHFYPVAVAVVFAVTFVAVLMNFLLYSEAGDEENALELQELDDSLTAEWVNLPHKLDVIVMRSNEHGHFVTVALDRTIAVSTFDRGRQSFTTVAVPPDVLSSLRWPTHDVAVDDSGDWIACRGADDRIAVYDCSSGAFNPDLLQYPDDHPPLIFSLVQLPRSAGMKLHVVALTAGGRLIVGPVEGSARSEPLEISSVPLVGAAVLHFDTQDPHLFALTVEAQLVSFQWNVTADTWTRSRSLKLDIESIGCRLFGSSSIDHFPAPDATLLVVTASTYVVFLQSDTLATVAKWDLSDAGLAFDTIMISPGRNCHFCDGPTARKLAALSSSTKNGRGSLNTWSPAIDEDEGICLRDHSASCSSFAHAKFEKHEVPDAGASGPLLPDAILGLRERNLEGSSSKTTPSVRSRARQRRSRTASNSSTLQKWEAYRLSIDGEIETLQLDEPGPEALYVVDAGPAVSLGSLGVVVALGNVVTVVRTSRRGAIVRRVVGSGIERRTSTTGRRRGVNRRGR